MKLESRLTAVKGAGEALAQKLAGLGVQTVGELLSFYPRKYEDYSEVQPIKHLRPGAVTIKAFIKQVKGRYVRRGLHITEAIASDETDSVRLVWFNQPYRAAALRPASPYYISGQFELSRQRLAIMNPSVELVSNFPVQTARIVPIYREVKGLKSHQVRRVVREVIKSGLKVSESLPKWLIDEHRLMNRQLAVETMHFPATTKDLVAAKRRLGFEEVFELSLASLLNKQELLQVQALIIPFKERLAKEFVRHLPFKLTDGQRKVIWKIYLDMQKSQPMNRLVEGDVGSGKTVVATMAALMVMEQSMQVAFMAPTELLARQHAQTIHNLLSPLGYEKQVSLLIGSMNPKQKQTAYKNIKNGLVRFLVGTHALIQAKVDMHRLGLIIIDEQHRFGVDQRKKLQSKAGHMPHVLSLTATPIPRSLALTLYGELDVSLLDSQPANRRPTVTEICSPNSRPQLYRQIETELKKGRQMFVVCPIITDSEHHRLGRSAEKVYQELKSDYFKNWQVGLLHGKMKSEQKNRVMADFVNHRLDILVATTVIEVGVDVPNATVMLVEDAERFGLAQLHQLRGRVGRSQHQGYCYLMMSTSAAPTKRLEALARSADGFMLAELDLELRGPGAIYGTLQHGQLDLRVANLTDMRLITAARGAAQRFIEKGQDLLEYPELQRRVQALRAVTNLN